MRQLLCKLKNSMVSIRRYLACDEPRGLVVSLDASTIPQAYIEGLSEDHTYPHDTILVLDVSGSMLSMDCGSSRLEVSAEASQKYVRKRLERSPRDRVAIVTFNLRGKTVLTLTNVRHLNKIENRLSQLKADGGTDIAKGLKKANGLFARDLKQHPVTARFRRVLLLTDGQGGEPLIWANHLKGAGVLIDVIGIGGTPDEVNERLLRLVATTDGNNFVHYWFFHDTQKLIDHYEKLATGLVYRGPEE